jgi:hypothetical protein
MVVLWRSDDGSRLQIRAYGQTPLYTLGDTPGFVANSTFPGVPGTTPTLPPVDVGGRVRRRLVGGDSVCVGGSAPAPMVWGGFRGGGTSRG